MFGLMLPGGLQVSEDKFLHLLPCVKDTNHIIIFMTGQTPFPDGFGGGGATTAYGSHPFAKDLIVGGGEEVVDAKVGISIEKIDELMRLTPADGTQIDNSIDSDTIQSFTTYIAKNVYDFASSFAKDDPQCGETIVPLSCIYKWFTIIQNKLNLDPSFWRK